MLDSARCIPVQFEVDQNPSGRYQRKCRGKYLLSRFGIHLGAVIDRFRIPCRGTWVDQSLSSNDVIFILVIMKYNVTKLCTCSEMMFVCVSYQYHLRNSCRATWHPRILICKARTKLETSDILRHQTRLPEVPLSFPGVKKAAATLEETAPKRPKAAPLKASKASKASSDESSDEGGKDAKDGQKDDAADAVEVKDAETLWKVNIEAVYRRKNPWTWRVLCLMCLRWRLMYDSSAEDLQFIRRFTRARKLLLKVPEFIAKYKACSWAFFCGV